jgi:hypothetical protein
VFKVKLYKHAGTGALKGDALVTYMSAEESDKAASLLHRQSIRSGYVISVKKADFTQSESKKRVRFNSSSHYYVRIICQRLLAAAGLAYIYM